ncbi:lysozyme inhibitor LprI family protein [Acinetobacter piscicola]|uniref:lysozyme inhibitor LprI family protein n=1 Tax=Acinetobacter piscicola TaxID=2006115 RepID=UPI000B7E6F01|nr:lysozyme inhibitor LprI family protein [Acinetobacter piscicola]
MKSYLYIFMVFTCISSITQAASFNCDKAQTQTEYAICEHRNLNDADVKMATTYNIIRKLVPMGTRGVIQDQQVKWLQLRNQCQDNVSCLTDVYKMRQQKLEIYMNGVYQQGPF